MRAKEFIIESMTFIPAVMKDFTDHEGKPSKLLTSEPWMRKEEQDCFLCDGTGKETYGDMSRVCSRCHGTGKTEEEVSDAPELNVSNANGYAIQEMLGLDPDYSGTIYNKDLPQIMRRLIELKNKGSSEYTQEPSVSRGPMRKSKDDQGITKISPGATSHDFGRSQGQVDRYIDELIKMVQFAQKNNAHISWG